MDIQGLKTNTNIEGIGLRIEAPKHTFIYYPHGVLVDSKYLIPWHSIEYLTIAPEKPKGKK